MAVLWVAQLVWLWLTFAWKSLRILPLQRLLPNQKQNFVDNSFSITNKMPAQAFILPAEKKIGSKWALCTTAQAGNIKSGYLRNIIIHCSCFMPCDWSIACTR